MKTITFILVGILLVLAGCVKNTNDSEIVATFQNSEPCYPMFVTMTYYVYDDTAELIITGRDKLEIVSKGNSSAKIDWIGCKGNKNEKEKNRK